MWFGVSVKITGLAFVLDTNISFVGVGLHGYSDCMITEIPMHFSTFMILAEA